LDTIAAEVQAVELTEDEKRIIEEDLKDAFSWHEDKRIGLGHDFLLQVDAGINFINRNPEIHSI
jgi:hypothetical protein